ncbi:MAG: polysaccharide deacetylase family protein, partial [Alphaproteobacteria bacterium]|nr:polysaccharide deacetylase family protein [Alphaproteobacteria bacterium]
MNGWETLGRELDLWHRAWAQARVWWRDDDAQASTQDLDRLLTVASGAPLALAVIPAWIDPSLVKRVHGLNTVEILPHGYAHKNHEPVDRKKAEFGASRKPAEALLEIRQSMALLVKAFGDQVFPLFVPPWNRIAPEIAQQLSEVGLQGVSTFTD